MPPVDEFQSVNQTAVCCTEGMPLGIIMQGESDSATMAPPTWSTAAASTGRAEEDSSFTLSKGK